MITLYLSIVEAKNVYDELERLVLECGTVTIVDSLLLSLSYRIEAADAV